MDNEDIKFIEDDYTAEELHRLFLTYLRCQEHIKGMTSSPEQADLMEMVELAGEYICELVYELSGDDMKEGFSVETLFQRLYDIAAMEPNGEEQHG